MQCYFTHVVSYGGIGQRNTHGGVSVQKLQSVTIISKRVDFIFLILNNYANNLGAVDKTLNDRSLKLQIQVSLKFLKILIYKETLGELRYLR